MRGGKACFFGIFNDEVRHPINQRMDEPFADGASAPRGFLFLFLDLAFNPGRKSDQSISRVGPPVKQDILNMGQQIGRNPVINRELARVHDRHIEARADGVIEERRVHRLAHGVVAAKRKRHVTESTAD